MLWRRGRVEGDRLAFRVTASVDNDVKDLKTLVQLEKKRGSLYEVNAADLIWLHLNKYLSMTHRACINLRSFKFNRPLGLNGHAISDKKTVILLLRGSGVVSSPLLSKSKSLVQANIPVVDNIECSSSIYGG